MTCSSVYKHAVVVGALRFAAVGATAGTQTIDFENLAVGTVVTNQYDGVTFSASSQSCSGAPLINLIIRTPNGGTASGTKGLGISTGCPDFSPDGLRIVFDQDQQEVTFTVGDSPGTYQVRAYTAAGGVAVPTQNIVVGGSGWVGVYHLVRVQSGSANIRRIEIQDTIGDFEVIDDLTFACPDTTPPVVEITSPAYEACVCSNSVTLYGLSCDEEGYDHDQLEYLPVNAPAGTAWTLVGSYSSPQCTPGGALYNWNTAALPEGYYYAKITARNACGLESTAIVVVCVDRSPDVPVLRSPASGAILGGVVCVDGTVWDGANAACFDTYRVEYKPSVGGAWHPVDPAHPTYSLPVVNDPLASWDTRNALPAVTDGKWQIRAIATNTCAAESASVIRNVIIDNTPPVAFISAPLNCQSVEGTVPIRGTVDDFNLDGWVLQYTGGDAQGWVTIASGNAPVASSVLATWDTAGLRRCAYTLRLIAADSAVLDCNGALHNQTEYLVSVYLGPVGHFDYDGDEDVDMSDYAVFQRCFSGPGVPAALDCRD